MGTVQVDVLEPALRKLHIWSPDTTELSNALSAFNSMVSSLSAEDVFLPFYTRENFTLTAAKGTYTWGSGGDFGTTRPEEVVSAFIRDTNGNDYEVETNMSLEEYNLILDKDVAARPERLLYLREYPLGKIVFDSAPTTAEDLYIDTLKQIAELATVGDTLTIPPEYKEFFIFNLAVRMTPEFDVILPQEVKDIAKESLERVSSQNFKKLISTVRMDPLLLVNSRDNGYNIYTDST